MAAASLAVRLTAQIAEFEAEFKQVNKTLSKFGNEFEGVATRAAAVGTFIGNIAADIAKSVARGLGQAAADAVRLSSEFSNAFTGLSSVATAFGTDAGVARDAAKTLASDGLLPVKDAASGLKNLLAAGFSLPEATQLMNAFKDSAAFGRQGALSFGEAVRSATEGVKNGNSILVDNAGITKNLSQILKEAGFSAQDLSRASSDASVRQALFNGILREAAAFAGDAQRATETYSGQVARLGTAYDTFLASVGNAITQNATVGRAIGFVSDQLINLTTNLTGTKQGFDLVSRAVIFVVQSFAELLNVADLVQTGFAGLQIAFNKVGAAYTSFAAKLFRVGEAAQLAMRFLEPSKWQEHADAARQAKDAYTFLEGAVQGFKDASKDAEKRSITFGNALQTARRVVSDLAKDLETTRGQTIKLGDSGRDAGNALAAGLGAGVARAKTALKDFDTLLANIGGPHKIGLSTEVGTEVNLKLGFPSEIALQQQIQDGVTRITAGMRGVTLDIETEVRLPNVTLPQTFWQQMFSDTKGLGAAIGNAIAGAIQGGGNIFSAAAGALGQGLTSKLSGWLTTTKDAGGFGLSGLLGGMVSSVLPGVGALLGPLVGKLTDTLKQAFGGPSKDERLGREVVAQFEQQIQGTLSAAERLAAGNESWKLTAIAVRDAYAAAGRTAAESEAAVKKLWESSKRGADASRLAVLEIQAVMDLAADKQKAAGDAIATQAKETSAAALALTDRIKGLGSQYDSLFNSIKNEAPEEEMGILERRTRDAMASIEREIRDVSRDGFGRMGAAAEDAWRAIEDAFKQGTIKVPLEFVLPDGLKVPGIQAMASGGVVNRPTLALIGESGPEAVVPLSGRRGSLPSMAPIIVQTFLDGRQVAEATVPHIPNVVRRMG